MLVDFDGVAIPPICGADVLPVKATSGLLVSEVGIDGETVDMLKSALFFCFYPR